MTVSPKHDFMVELTGGIVLLLGAVVMLGWLLDIPVLTHVSPSWKPMVPATALCFSLGGLALLVSGTTSTWFGHRRIPDLLIGLLFGIAGARGLELLLGNASVPEITAPLWIWLYKNQGQMSVQTAWGFLVFIAGFLMLHWGKSRSSRLAARTIALGLFVVGLATVFAYAIKLPYLFEAEFIKTGLIWLSMPTAIGLTLLGLGLWSKAQQSDQSGQPVGTQRRAGQIYRATVLVISLTTLITGMVGIMFLENATLDQSKADMTQTIETKQAHLSSLLEDHIERARLASTDPALIASVQGLLQNVRHKVPITVQTQITERLIQHGFTGVGLESGHQIKTIIGKLLPDSATLFPLGENPHAYLIWDKEYYLRMRIPVTGTKPGSPEGYLIIEQAMPRVSKLINDANHWGETGTLPMCGRLNAKQLICYPQREQPDIYIVPDNYQGVPIPMAHALAGKHNVAVRTDYRGRHVLAAYGPVDHSGLGLVLKMDLSEVYAPVKQELLLLLPLIVFLALLGLGLIQLRARPLLDDLAESHEAESTARSRFEAAMDSSPDIFIIYEAVRDDDGEVVDFRASYANKNAATNTRLSTKNMTNHSCVELLPAQKGLIESYHTVLKTGQSLVNECTWTDPEAETHWYQRQVVAMPTGVAVTFRNIT